jgi:general secretion pathway protein B
MSFILDALKKSEAERQRQTGPTLLELRITRPRRRYPVWVLVIGSLLAVNVIVLLFLALHRPSGQGGTASAAALPRASPSVAALPAASSSVASSASAAAAAKPVVAAAAAAPLPNASGTGGAGSAGSADSAGSPGSGAAKVAVPALAVTADNGAKATTPTTPHNPADDEPAVSAAGPAVSGQAKPPTAGGNYTSLPSAASLGDSVPTLQLNMLVSSKDSADRYALINMQRVHEGDVLPEGARVLAITPDGVAMEYHGQDFLLPRAATAAQ